MTIPHSAMLTHRTLAAEGLYLLRFQVDEKLSTAHQHPGQYVKLSLAPFGEGFFALASLPLQFPQVFEFLVRPDSPLSEALIRLPIGENVFVQGPLGHGFPLHLAKDKNVMLFATGTGIGAVRPVLELICSDRKSYQNVRFYYGVRTPQAVAFSERFPIWHAAGIQTFLTVSQPGKTGWQGLVGYVQNHVAELRIENATAFLSGQDQMIAAVRSVLVSRGLSPEDIHLNF